MALVEATGRTGVAAPARSVSKRTLDVLGAIFVLLFFLPVGLVMLVGIRCCRPGPIFVREETLGLNGRTFGRWRLYRPAQDESLFDQVLWRAGLGDLPSAVNVIDGDMPTPNSWLSDGPPTPRWVVSSTTDRLIGVAVLDVKVSSPFGPRANAP